MSARTDYSGLGGAYVRDPDSGALHPRGSSEAVKLLAGDRGRERKPDRKSDPGAERKPARKHQQEDAT
jgi:hypothetical protein